MSIELNIIQEDINQGCRVEAFGCPVHYALSRVLKSEYSSGVTHQYSDILYSNDTEGDYLYRMYHSTELEKWIEGYDRTGKANPATFQVVIPSEYLA